MHFSPILLLAATAAAFTIPAGQSDGVYSVHTNTDGQEVHTFMSALPDEVSPRDDRYVNRRQIPGTQNNVGCGNYPLNKAEANAAASGMRSQCGNGAEVDKGRDFYSLSGCTVAYFCNLSGGGVTCFSSEWDQSAVFIAATCGSYNAGWDHIQNTGRTAQYGQEDNCSQGKNFCGRGTNGKL